MFRKQAVQGEWSRPLHLTLLLQLHSRLITLIFMFAKSNYAPAIRNNNAQLCDIHKQP